jgi:hypothetical protein
MRAGDGQIEPTVPRQYIYLFISPSYKHMNQQCNTRAT